jgi:fatty acid desaturase
VLIPQSEYAKKLRPLLPPEAFQPDINKLIILFINIAILILGWGIARHLHEWSVYWLWLYLPLAVIMGNSITVGFLSYHDLMHGSVRKSSNSTYFMSLLGSCIPFMPPTQWKNLHNRVHHNHTNSVKDPDRSFLYEQPNNWGKWLHHQLVPSNEINPFMLVLGLSTVWSLYTFRNLASVLLFNNDHVDFVPASFQVPNKQRLIIAGESLFIFAVHATVIWYLGLHPLNIILGYILPTALGHAGAMFYIFTQHINCRMTEVNDPLINSVSMRLHPLIDLLHLNFSYHTEHHIFPSMNSDYYPQVQELLQIHYPNRMNLVTGKEAWQTLLSNPHHYKDETTLTDYAGTMTVPCPLDNSNLSEVDLHLAVGQVQS